MLDKFKPIRMQLISNDIFSVQIRPTSNIFEFDKYYEQIYAKWTEVEIVPKEYSMFVIEEYNVRWPRDRDMKKSMMSGKNAEKADYSIMKSGMKAIFPSTRI